MRLKAIPVFRTWERREVFQVQTNESFVERRGLYDISQWDGPDIFLVHGYIITERVMKLLKTNKVIAVQYEKLSDLVDFKSELRLSNG